MDGVIGILLAWTFYFVLHSTLASLTAKQWVARNRPHWMRWYRLGFNSLAAVLLVPPLWLTYAQRGPLLWDFEGWQAGLAYALQLIALVLFLWSLRYYDGLEFLGLRQLTEHRRRAEDQERLQISPLHRHVRHPWYSLGLVLLWARDMYLGQLAATLAVTIYLAVGSRLEERKLLTYHGDAYARYRDRVPGLIPRPWRRLSADEADAIIRDQKNP